MVCDNIRPYKEYIKVTLSGLLAAAIIQGIFLFLTNVDTLLVIPENGGIKCLAKETTDKKYCEGTVTDIMYSTLHPDPFDNSTNITNTSILQTSTMESTIFFYEFLMNTTIIEYSPEWDCGLHTDYRNAPFFETFLFTFSSAESYLIILVTFTFVYVFFAITHDWTLIYYKNDLDQVSFLPTSTKEFVLTSLLPSSFWDIYSKLAEAACAKGCCCCLLTGPIYLVIFMLLSAYMIFDAVLTHTIMPFIWFFQSSLFGKKQRYNIVTISYISASYVGIARFWMTFSTIGMLVKSVYGFSFEIPSWDGDKCECECVYIFNEWDWYRLFFTTSLFVILNMKFLWSWTMEAAHGKHYLYLITHTLPVEHANAINPVECTGGMMKDVYVRITDDKVKQQLVMDMAAKNPAEVEALLSLSARLHEEKNMEEQHEAGAIELQTIPKPNTGNIVMEQHDENEEEYTAQDDEEIDGIFSFAWRAVMLILSGGFYLIYGGQVNNYYGYPDWAVSAGFVAALWICVCGGYGEVKGGKYLLKLYDKEHSES